MASSPPSIKDLREGDRVEVQSYGTTSSEAGGSSLPCWLPAVVAGWTCEEDSSPRLLVTYQSNGHPCIKKLTLGSGNIRTSWRTYEDSEVTHILEDRVPSTDPHPRSPKRRSSQTKTEQGTQERDSARLQRLGTASENITDALGEPVQTHMGRLSQIEHDPGRC